MKALVPDVVAAPLAPACLRFEVNVNLAAGPNSMVARNRAWESEFQAELRKLTACDKKWFA